MPYCLPYLIANLQCIAESALPTRLLNRMGMTRVFSILMFYSQFWEQPTGVCWMARSKARNRIWMALQNNVPWKNEKPSDCPRAGLGSRFSFWPPSSCTIPIIQTCVTYDAPYTCTYACCCHDHLDGFHIGKKNMMTALHHQGWNHVFNLRVLEPLKFPSRLGVSEFNSDLFWGALSIVICGTWWDIL